MSMISSTNANHFPLVSIIVPIYNAEDYLERCVSSITNQSYTNLEIILVNDGSTDSTKALCDCLAAKDKRIRVIHQNNQGLSATRNNALQVIRGTYIAFVDADDYIGPNHIKNLLTTAIESEAKMAVTGLTPVFGNEISSEALSAIVPSDSSVYEAQEAACIAVKSVMHPFAEHACGKIYSTSLKTYLHFPEGKKWEDQFVMYKIMLASETVAYENANDYYYVQNPHSMSRTRDEHFLDTLEARKQIIDFASSHQLRQLEETAIKKYHSRVIGIYADLNLLEQGDLTEKVYQLILSNRKEALRSPYLATTTKIGYFLSYLPKGIFSKLIRNLEKQRLKRLPQPPTS